MMTAETEIKFSDAMEFVGKYMKENDLIMIPREWAEEDKLKDRFSKKTALTMKQIADSKIWGDIGKQAVKLRVVKYLENGDLHEHEIDRSSKPFKIRRQGFERIAKRLGTL